MTTAGSLGDVVPHWHGHCLPNGKGSRAACPRFKGFRRYYWTGWWQVKGAPAAIAQKMGGMM